MQCICTCVTCDHCICICVTCDHQPRCLRPPSPGLRHLPRQSNTRRFEVWGLGFGVWGLGFRVGGLWFGVQVLVLRVTCLTFCYTPHPCNSSAFLRSPSDPIALPPPLTRCMRLLLCAGPSCVRAACSYYPTSNFTTDFLNEVTCLHQMASARHGRRVVHVALPCPPTRLTRCFQSACCAAGDEGGWWG